VAIILWVVNAAFFIQFIARLRFAGSSCVPANIESNQLNMIAMAVTDIALLLIMLVGLLRLRYHGNDMFGLTQVLWKQGVIWLLLALVAEIPPVVFIILKLNVSFDTMFQFPAYITMTIAATRLYRSLVDFNSSSTDLFTTNVDIRNGGTLVPETKRINAASIPISQVEVATDIFSERHVPLSMVDHDSHISTDEKTHDKPEGLSLDGDVERGV